MNESMIDRLIDQSIFTQQHKTKTKNKNKIALVASSLPRQRQRQGSGGSRQQAAGSSGDAPDMHGSNEIDQLPRDRESIIKIE